MGRVIRLLDKLLRQAEKAADRTVGAVRERALKERLAACGGNVRVRWPFRITGEEGIRLGDNVHINRGALIRGEGGLEIGDNVHIARNAVIYTVNHDTGGSRLPYDEGLVRRPVTIGRNAWIGVGCTIVPGASIGEGAVVGAGTVVAGEVPAMAVVAGSPQREIGRRDPDHYRNLDLAGAYGGEDGRAPGKERRK